MELASVPSPCAAWVIAVWTSDAELSCESMTGVVEPVFEAANLIASATEGVESVVGEGCRSGSSAVCIVSELLLCDFLCLFFGLDVAFFGAH